MATDDIKDLTAMQRLARAREEFAAMNVKKTGVNRHLEYKYFTLGDILPPARTVLNKYGLFPIFSATQDTAIMSIYSIESDNPADCVTISIPFDPGEGNRATSAPQAIGAAVTYLRRYLYIIALEIEEEDALDEGLGVAEKPKSQRPATPEKKAEVVETLLNPDNQAPETLITSLKKKFAQLRKADPTEAEWIKEILGRTNKLTDISKGDCESLILEVNAKLKELKK